MFQPRRASPGVIPACKASKGKKAWVGVGLLARALARTVYSLQPQPQPSLKESIETRLDGLCARP